ncbi:hypothetical protein BJ684DRAFT_7721 [Piptocephalis cylindrospora]|uniref:Phox homologous domain-containing protein n=1 Tax=Piptocephalis cylindrospora TaxID=1907219 RepID=A0A4V1IYL9_9FUNG|nr:hypothetical protein BJ684DRAFT_7721 [Piptocephalis cylindrospora]|eukprot:RKP15019.1 hypothetical protein BJ684DRAFT_7721 [Piptocephalis cylindrospora]
MRFNPLSGLLRPRGSEEAHAHQQQQHQQQRPTFPQRATAPAAIIPPKKVIRALYDFTAETEHELSFREGDFFHVIGNENDRDWFEAYNPISNVRGMVPVSFFQVIGRSVSGESGARTSLHRQPLPGLVLYDFTPERPDELACTAGDTVVVIAQSNEEWFVAMHPGKLGGPGLVPVAFLEIRDPVTEEPVTDVPAMLEARGMELPGEEEVGADGYWFDLRLRFGPGVDEESRIVWRRYEDFHLFHLTLLEAFPVEAGKAGMGDRIIPYLPGPLSQVDDDVCSERRAQLDGYLQQLLTLPSKIKDHPLLHAFLDFAPNHPPLPSSISGVGTLSGGPNGGMLKVKVQHGDDLYAIRVPSRVSFKLLWDRIHDRLGEGVGKIQWKDPSSGSYRPLEDNEDLHLALAESSWKLSVLATSR